MNNIRDSRENGKKTAPDGRNNYRKRPVPQNNRTENFSPNRRNAPANGSGMHGNSSGKKPPVKGHPETLGEQAGAYLSLLSRNIKDGIRNAWLSVFIDKYDVFKALIITGFILLSGMLQITVFARVKPFGATPDLLLPIVCAVGISEGEKWGSVFALIAAFYIDSIGGTGLTLLPLVYTPAAFTAGVMGRYFVKDSVPFRGLFIVSSGLLKAVSTIICTVAAFSTVTASSLFGKIVLPEYFSTVIFSVIPHTAVYFSLKPFHKTRSERVGKQ